MSTFNSRWGAVDVSTSLGLFCMSLYLFFIVCVWPISFPLYGSVLAGICLVDILQEVDSSRRHAGGLLSDIRSGILRVTAALAEVSCLDWLVSAFRIVYTAAFFYLAPPMLSFRVIMTHAWTVIFSPDQLVDDVDSLESETPRRPRNLLSEEVVLLIFLLVTYAAPWSLWFDLLPLAAMVVNFPGRVGDLTKKALRSLGRLLNLSEFGSIPSEEALVILILHSYALLGSFGRDLLLLLVFFANFIYDGHGLVGCCYQSRSLRGGQDGSHMESNGENETRNETDRDVKEEEEEDATNSETAVEEEEEESQVQDSTDADDNNAMDFVLVTTTEDIVR